MDGDFSQVPGQPNVYIRHLGIVRSAQASEGRQCRTTHLDWAPMEVISATKTALIA
jgi:hypothetical protein